MWGRGGSPSRGGSPKALHTGLIHTLLYVITIHTHTSLCYLSYAYMWRDGWPKIPGLTRYTPRFFSFFSPSHKGLPTNLPMFFFYSRISAFFALMTVKLKIKKNPGRKFCKCRAMGPKNGNLALNKLQIFAGDCFTRFTYKN